MDGFITLTDAELDAVSGGQGGRGGRGGRGGDAIAVSAAVIFVGGNVDDSTLSATSGDATAAGGAGGNGGAGGDD
jgi:bacteriocin-like protein